MPSPPSTGPSDARGRRSSAFVWKMRGLHLAQLLSVNVGQPREITWRGKTVYTSVWKEPVQLTAAGRNGGEPSGQASPATQPSGVSVELSALLRISARGPYSE